MTQLVDVFNRALQVIGTRTTMTLAEFQNQTSNEAIQIGLVQNQLRRRLLRMAPWNFAMKTANLVYITSSPGTPENPINATTLWAPGQPAPPWNYEYQYPVDCVRMCFVIPSTQTGFAGGIPITTAVTGGAASFWQGPPVKFKIQNDQFYPVIAAAVANGGSGYAVNDIITLAQPTNTNNLTLGTVGAPALLVVTGVTGGVITGVAVVNQVYGETTGTLGGSYFVSQTNPQVQGSTSGSGTGATFTLTYGPIGSQSVVLCNQEFAIGTYVQDITDPNNMDDAFQECWANVLGATICIALSGDKKLANGAIQSANVIIERARTMDGDEGFTVNDVTPDWIRIRGIDFSAPYSGPFTGFDWGGLFPIFG
jgi:hypothetical protein